EPPAPRHGRSARPPARAVRGKGPALPGGRRHRRGVGKPERAGAHTHPVGQAGGAMESLRVALGERSYPIHIGAGLLYAADLYRPHLAGGAAAIVTSRSIAPLYLPRVRKALETAGAKVAEIVMEDGEQAK